MRTSAISEKEKDSCCLGIDIGGTHIRLALVDGQYRAAAFELLNTQEVLTGAGTTAENLGRCIWEYSRRNSGGELPQAVSIGFPSTINRAHTVVLQTPNIDCIPDHCTAAADLAAELGIPVFINRDVNNLLLYDVMDLQLENCDTIAGIYFGTGIGNAIMIGGKMLYGHNGVAAELGHVPVYGNHRVCNCGNTGCLETIASGSALQQIRSTCFPETEVGELFTRHGTSPELKDFVTAMAQTAALEINLLDPDAIVIGGGLLSMKDFPTGEMEEEIRRYARKPYPAENLRILYSRPDQINGTIGAAVYAGKRMQNPAYL